MGEEFLDGGGGLLGGFDDFQINCQLVVVDDSVGIPEMVYDFKSGALSES